jgi:hypothetical protein
MTANMLEAATDLYKQGLSIIPVAPGDKKPALETWTDYMKTRADMSEVESWFGNGHEHNLGVIHGEVSGNYIVIDVDKDSGVFNEIRNAFPQLFTGRYVITGSRQGYHVPLKLGALPDLGWNAKENRPRGNKTWKTKTGSVNIRAQYCQSLAPPSMHKSGYEYAFIQEGPISWVPDLDDLMEWLNKLAPPKAKALKKKRDVGQRGQTQTDGDTLLDQVLSVWKTYDIFDHFGLIDKTRVDPSGDMRILGNGGLLIHPNGEAWNCFEQDIGGGPIEAWAWQRFGHFDPSKHFRQVLIEMAWAGGIDLGGHLRESDRKYLVGLQSSGDRSRWTRERAPHWQYQSPT